RGGIYDFETLLKERAPGFAQETVIETRKERHARCQRALDFLGKKFNDAAPDALVIFGNDQRELFNDELTPAVTIYRAKEIQNIPSTHNELSLGLGIAEQGNCAPGGATYPGAPDLADHLIRSLIEQDFDLAQSTALPSNVTRQGIPHAYGFVYHRVLR